MIDKIQRKYKGDKEKGFTSVLVLLDSMLDVLGEKLTTGHRVVFIWSGSSPVSTCEMWPQCADHLLFSSVCWSP